MSDWEDVTLEEIRVGDLLGKRMDYINPTLPRWGVKTFLVHKGHAITIGYYDNDTFECVPQELGYSAYWVYEKIIKTWKFDE